MVGWVILAVIATLLLILLLAPASLRLRYEDGELLLKARYLFWAFDLSPESLAHRPHEKKEAKKSKKKAKPEEKGAGLMEAVPGLLRASAGARHILHNHIVLDRVLVEGAVCAEDAHQTALAFAKITGGVYALLAAVGLLVTLKEPQVLISPDFLGERSRFRVSLRLWARPMFVLAAAVNLLWKFLMIQYKQKARKGGITYEPTASPQ